MRHFFQPIAEAWTSHRLQTRANEIIARFHPLSCEDIERIHLTERFDAIAGLKTHVENMDPCPEDHETPIDFSRFPEIADTLFKISSTIRSSGEYTSTLIFAGQDAIDQLTENARDVATWLNWANVNAEAQENMLVRLQAAIIQSTKLHFGEDTAFAQHLDTVPIHSFEEPGTTPEGEERLFQLGYATSKLAGACCNTIGRNISPDATPENREMAAGIIGHETAHAIEEQVASFYHERPHDIAPILARDARQFLYQKQHDGYMSMRYGQLYRYQFNEQVASDVGHAIERRLASRLQGVTHPGLS